jgi:hypothetical protein
MPQDNTNARIPLQAISAATDHSTYLYDLYVGHFRRCKDHPSVENFRLCVEAYDALIAEMRKPS